MLNNELKFPGRASLPSSLNLAKVIPIIVLLIALTALFGSWYTVDQGERGVILRNGKIIGTAEPGLGFKMPLIDTVVKISAQTHTTSYQSLAGL